MIHPFRLTLALGIIGIFSTPAQAEHPSGCLYDDQAGGESTGRPFDSASCNQSEAGRWYDVLGLFGTKTVVSLALLREKKAVMTYPMSDLDECEAVLFALTGKQAFSKGGEKIYRKTLFPAATDKPVPYLRVTKGMITTQISYGAVYDTECTPIEVNEKERPLSEAKIKLAELKSRALETKDDPEENNKGDATPRVASPARLTGSAGRDTKPTDKTKALKETIEYLEPALKARIEENAAESSK